MTRRVVVAGAGRPLGMALVHAALARGDRVLAGVRRPDAVPALGDLAAEVGDRLRVAPFEAAAEASCAALAAAADRAWGAVDLLLDVALATGGDGRVGDDDHRQAFAGADGAELAGLLRVNAVGPLLLARAFAPLLAAGRQPVLLVASPWVGSLAGKSQGGDYGRCASAAARNMIVRTLAHDLAPQGIAVVLGNPGNYRTDPEGLAFQHPVDVAATGLLALVDTPAPEPFVWRDWTGATRAW